MIPVRIVCSEQQIEAISDMTAVYYEQLAVMFYRVADLVKIKAYDETRKFKPCPCSKTSSPTV